MEDIASEVPLFGNRRVTVTPTKMIVGKRTYLLSDYASATVGDSPVIWAVSLPFLLLGLINTIGGSTTLGAMMVAMAIWLPTSPLLRTKCVFLNSSVLVGDGKAAKAYGSRDPEELAQIAKAVNRVISGSQRSAS